MGKFKFADRPEQGPASPGRLWLAGILETHKRVMHSVALASLRFTSTHPALEILAPMVSKTPARFLGLLCLRSVKRIYGVSRSGGTMIPAANAAKLNLPPPVQAIIPTHFFPGVHDVTSVAALILQTYIVENVLAVRLGECQTNHDFADL
jgi:hypothetical protein